MGTVEVQEPTNTDTNEIDVLETTQGTPANTNTENATGANNTDGNVADKGGIEQHDGEGHADGKDTNTQTDTGEPEAGLVNRIDAQNKADKDAKETLTDKNIDFDALSDEYVQNGNKLSDKTYESLEKAGYPKSVVDTFIAGKQALVNQFSNTIINHAGGQEAYTKLTNAIKAKGQDAVNAYNSLIDSGNISAIKMVLDGVRGDVVKKNGTNNPSVLGGVSTAQTGGYADVSAMETAMNDKRYGRDETYTLEVQNKVAKSTFIQCGN